MTLAKVRPVAIVPTTMAASTCRKTRHNRVGCRWSATSDGPSCGGCTCRAGSTTAATLLRTAHHLHHLGATLGELVLEPEADGIPLCGRPDEEVTCEICQRAVGADVARTIEVTTPWHHQVKVCSVTCSRAARAGEHTY